MSYADDRFWERYERYVAETMPHHQLIADAIRPSFAGRTPAILDLGCGKSRMASKLFPGAYRGVDKEHFGQEVVCDYSLLYSFDSVLHERGPNVVVVAMSLFSTECCMAPEDAADMYARLLSDGAQMVVAAGFYYADRMAHAKVSEAGGLVSWQTLPSTPFMDGETRIVRPVPSRLFGNTVVEVWRVISPKDVSQ